MKLGEKGERRRQDRRVQVRRGMGVMISMGGGVLLGMRVVVMRLVVMRLVVMPIVVMRVVVMPIIVMPIIVMRLIVMPIIVMRLIVVMRRMMMPVLVQMNRRQHHKDLRPNHDDPPRPSTAHAQTRQLGAGEHDGRILG